MANKSALGRMIIFLSFSIISLVILSIRLTNQSNVNNNIYNKYIMWDYKGQEFKILLHSINLRKMSFTGYSLNKDSVLLFPIMNDDIDWINKQFIKYNYIPKNCISCHQSN